MLVIVLVATEVESADNGLALTPPMGWLSWQRFRCNIDCVNDPYNCIGETLFLNMADRLYEDGWIHLGYDIVWVDDCWMDMTRDPKTEKLRPDASRFPHGIPFLADYFHERGLRLGIYGDFGKFTCGGYPGSIDHLELDANTFAEWGVDAFKMDGCYSNISDMDTGYPKMAQYLNNTGRPILFACSWPAYLQGRVPINYTLISEHCNIWRLYDDIQDDWGSVTSIINFWGNNQNQLVPAAGPGHFNDMDMIICGDFSLSVTECKSQMALWAILASPLLMSNDLRDLGDEYRAILQNREVIAINQDPLGRQGLRVFLSQDKLLSVWKRDLVDGSIAVALLNQRSDGTPTPITANFIDIGLPTSSGRIRDLYNSTDLGVYTRQYVAKVVPHGVVFVTITPV